MSFLVPFTDPVPWNLACAWLISLGIPIAVQQLTKTSLEKEEFRIKPHGIDLLDHDKFSRRSEGSLLV